MIRQHFDDNILQIAADSTKKTVLWKTSAMNSEDAF